MLEELGIFCPLKFRRLYHYRSDRQSEFNYLYYGIYDGPYGFDKNEVAAVKAFDCKKLVAKTYGDFEFLPHVLTYIRDLKDVWSPLVKKSGGRQKAITHKSSG